MNLIKIMALCVLCEPFPLQVCNRLHLDLSHRVKLHEKWIQVVVKKIMINVEVINF